MRDLAVHKVAHLDQRLIFGGSSRAGHKSSENSTFSGERFRKVDSKMM